VSSVGWGGGEAAIWSAGQVPAAFVDGPVMGPAQQRQVGQVGGAAVDPVVEVVGVAPAQGAVAAGEHTATVADGQGAGLGGVDDPGGPAEVQGLAGGAAQGWGQQGHGSPQLHLESRRAGWVVGRRGRFWGRRLVVSAGAVVGGGAVVRAMVVVDPAAARMLTAGLVVAVRGVAGDQDPGQRPSQASRRHAAGVRGPAHPSSPPSPSGWPRRLSRSTVTSSWGRMPPVWGSWPPSRARRASSARASARRWPPERGSSASAGRARGSRAASRVWPASGSSSPSMATRSSTVRVSHRPRRPWRRSAAWSAPLGSMTWRRYPTARRSRGGSRRRATWSRTGSASAAT
jgi:hypothetical protein